MKRFVFYIVWVLGVLTACTDEELVKHGKVGTEEVWATLCFGHRSFEEININTRATLNEVAESRVENLFVYVFDANGKRLYSHFYDSTNREAALPETLGNYWTVNNRTSTNNYDTNGEVMIKAPAMQGGSIYVIANLNADQLNISSEQLNTIRSLSELQALTVTLNQEITSRTGYFLMTGSVQNISVNTNGTITRGDSSDPVSVPLERLDAKVTVNVQIGQSGIANQEIKNFVPGSWQIMRLPKGTRILGGNTDAGELGYFDSPELFFESETGITKSFSFYMLENMKDVTSPTLTFNDRDLRNKNVDGSYNTTNGLWTHASEDATYMIIKGKVQMKVDTTEETDMQYLEADVVYYVHLGNFGDSKQGGDYNNFTINRNTHYTYNITIKGVNSIVVEVEDDREEQSGATGHVYKSKEEVYTFDAHYGQKVFRIDESSVDLDQVTWYVKTPFSEGMPMMESGTQIPNLDYQWVWFMVNDIEDDGRYSVKNRAYPGNKFQAVNYQDPNGVPDLLMNVVEFANFINEEKLKWKNDPSSSAFKKDVQGVYCLYVTAFVDEYYYEYDPFNSQNSPQDFWKQFVNKPNRLMHILCDSQHSKDGESSVTKSVLTIRQRSIQTPYNMEKPSLLTAWGCESVDEFADSQFFYYNNEESMYSEAGGNLSGLGAPSEVNGLYNSVQLWNITPGVTRWDEYLDYERINNYSKTINGRELKTFFLQDDYAVLRYSSLMRNRDNNGDGIIDADELRWYVASINQLYDLYMGQLGLESDAALYTPAIAARVNYNWNEPYAGANGWRNHVISSTWADYGKDGQNTYKQPVVLWAEEGISTSAYADRQNWNVKFAPYSVRCVRNLGLSQPAITEEGAEGTGYPERLIKVHEPNDPNVYVQFGVYRFDLSNINTKSLRYYTTRELGLGDENEETSRLYYGFETGNLVNYPTSDQGGYYNAGNYAALKEALEAGMNIGCDPGYRVPNVREAALMSLYCSSDWWGWQSIMTNTWYSNGDYGNGKDPTFTSWQFHYRQATIGNWAIYVRAVRDWNPTTE